MSAKKENVTEVEFVEVETLEKEVNESQANAENQSKESILKKIRKNGKYYTMKALRGLGLIMVGFGSAVGLGYLMSKKEEEPEDDDVTFYLDEHGISNENEEDFPGD